jgi:hypothetical protein
VNPSFSCVLSYFFFHFFSFLSFLSSPLFCLPSASIFCVLSHYCSRKTVPSYSCFHGTCSRLLLMLSISVIFLSCPVCITSVPCCLFCLTRASATQFYLISASTSSILYFSFLFLCPSSPELPFSLFCLIPAFLSFYPSLIPTSIFSDFPCISYPFPVFLIYKLFFFRTSVLPHFFRFSFLYSASLLYKPLLINKHRPCVYCSYLLGFEKVFICSYLPIYLFMPGYRLCKHGSGCLDSLRRFLHDR